MKKALFLLLALSLFVTGARTEELQYLDKLPPMIDREIFFGDPQITRAQISPTGEYISFLRPFKDKLNIWVKAIDEPFEDARPLSADTLRPVRGYGWSQDGKYILYIQDKGGDENFHVYAIDPSAGPAPGQEVPEARDLTPIDGVTVNFYAFPKKTPDIIYIGLNDRDERYHDVYRLEISSGKRTLVRENTEGMQSFEFDLDGNLRIASKETDDGGTEFFRIEGDKLVSFYTCTNEEQAGIRRYHKDNRRVYMVTNKGEENDLTRLILLDPVTGEEEFVESDPKKEVDFGGILFSNVTDELIGTTYTGDRLRIYWKDKKFKDAYKKLKKKLGDGDVLAGSSTNDDRLFLVSVTSDVDPGATYLFNMETGELEFLYRPRPDLPVEHLAKMKPVQYKSRDGLTIHAYLTVPQGIKAKNLPVVIFPHGGPWARDAWGYDGYVQFLANRGYAVFQPNFRASTGYGKAFFNAGKKQWGYTMQNDITDGVQYLIQKGIADPDKVAIFGGSYGGYATLAGLAFTPDLYACGVDYVGVSNMLTFLKSIPAYWETARKFLNEQVGDPDNPEDVERLKDQSPLFKADQIKAPLLVVQGANDPRVKKPESDQIVIAMRDLGRDVEYMIAPDEGHGFIGLENRMAFTTAMEKFFSKHLGGRYQKTMSDPVRERLETLTVPVETVKLEEPVGDIEAAMKAPLPAVDSGKIKPATAKYSTAVSTAGQEFNLDVVISLQEAKREGKPVWKIISDQTSPIFSASDTFEVDKATLLPIYRGVKQGSAHVALNFTPSSVNGAINIGPRKMPVNFDLPAPVYGSDAALDLVLAALPLSQGYQTSVRTFDIMSQSVTVYSLSVSGIENVTVPAGSFETYKIEIRRMDGEPGGGTSYIDTHAPHHLIRAVTQLPASAGGGTATSELIGVN
ncbi:MAG: S9 family peptidase [Candidatus Krumholzibacteriota bacterium]|nr:S9 family peptidase [Candidatus Krumholzibacteriota bacterium]